MNHPVRSRNIWLAVAGMGVVCLIVVFAGLAPERFGPVPFFAAGLIATPVGVIVMLVNQSQVRSMRRLDRGEGNIASWRVTPDEWRAFIALNAGFHNKEGVSKNVLDLEQAPPLDGVEVAATAQSVRVGAEFFDLRHLCSAFDGVNWLHTQPPVLEVLGRIQTKSTSYPVALRIPVSPASQKAAIDLHGAWSYRLLLRNAGSGRVRNPVRVRNIGFAISAAGMALMALPFLLSDLSLTYLLVSNLYGPMLALGFGCAVISGMVGLIFHFRNSKGYRAFLRESRVRWKVDGSAWRAFADFDRVRSAQTNVAFNFLSAARKVQASGVEVVAGEQGLMVDGELFLFSAIGGGEKIQPVWLDGPPLCLEVWGVFRTHGSSGSYTLRFPVDPGERAAVEALCAKWRALA